MKQMRDEVRKIIGMSIKSYTIIVLVIGVIVGILVPPATPETVTASNTIEETEIVIELDVPTTHKGTMEIPIERQNTMSTGFQIYSTPVKSIELINDLDSINEQLNPNALEVEPVEEPEYELYLYPTEKEMALLRQIVEAEVTGTGKWLGCSDGEAMLAKFRVARVIVNRVLSDDFPDTIEGVIYAKRQFTPVSDGRLYKVEVTDLTIQAVDLALRKDIPDDIPNALFFRQGGNWSAYNFIMEDATGHRFFSK